MVDDPGAITVELAIPAVCSREETPQLSVAFAEEKTADPLHIPLLVGTTVNPGQTAVSNREHKAKEHTNNGRLIVRHSHIDIAAQKGDGVHGVHNKPCMKRDANRKVKSVWLGVNGQTRRRDGARWSTVCVVRVAQPRKCVE
jgi:hypothetical protein